MKNKINKLIDYTVRSIYRMSTLLYSNLIIHMKLRTYSLAPIF